MRKSLLSGLQSRFVSISAERFEKLSGSVLTSHTTGQKIIIC
jgi:hypothetical protein